MWDGRAVATIIDTPSKRAKLAPRRNPYWQGISGGRGGVSLGYRRAVKGFGTWVAKVVLDGRRLEESLAVADDDGAPAEALTYRAAVAAALEWSRRQTEALERRGDDGAPEPTVASAIAEYLGARERQTVSGKIARGRMTNHVLADVAFAATKLSQLRSSTIEAWRGRLAVRDEDDEPTVGQMAPATLNRLLTDLRAALNAAAERYRRELPAHLPLEIKVGTRAISVQTVARKQLLTDDEVRRLVDAAFGVDDDFGMLAIVAAATGARFSQIAALRVRDVQAARGRVMMPGSRKGRSRSAKAAVAVPLSSAVLARLAPALEGRRGDEPLLTRWAYKRAERLKWERDRRVPWGAAYEIERPWSATVAAAELPGTIMYAFRHSSIVRGLAAGLPVRLVAALHDTSSDMIEAHYAAHIVDATEEIARRVALVA